MINPITNHKKSFEYCVYNNNEQKYKTNNLEHFDGVTAAIKI